VDVAKQKAGDDRLWQMYLEAESNGYLDDWLEHCMWEAQARDRPDVAEYTFRLFATRLREQGRLVPEMISAYLAAESGKAN
jgi:hypothetical protein